MSYLKVENIIKNYGSNDSVVEAVKGISFTIDIGEFVVIMGESGSGKSTLLSVLGAMNRPTSGKLVVDGIDIYDLNIEKQADFRREYLGFVFQSFHLVPYLTVIENVMLPLTTTRFSKKEKHEMALQALAQVGLEDKAHRLPSQVSGGEKERVAIARAMSNKPPILLADEPTGNLDSSTSQEIMELLQSLNEDGMTIVMVTHSHESAAYSERLLELSDGLLCKDGLLREVKSNA